ncbi:MAG: hypothetical protein HYX32_14195 [Actinobacteria bacterium]|nr:hypothetical protein [Actinomycetota bacterium]
MSNASFLLIVVIISVPAIFYMWLRSRKPTTFMSSIDEFRREMSALAHDPHQEIERKRKPQPLRPIVPSHNNHGLADKIRTAQKVRQASVPDEPRPRRRASKR